MKKYITKQRMLQVAITVALVVVLAVSWWRLNRHESEAPLQATDDAYVQADMTAVSPRVSGTIAKVFVKENQRVHAGDPLLTIDDRDLRVALDSARAQVATAQANVASMQAQIDRQESLLWEARAAIGAAEANGRSPRRITSALRTWHGVEQQASRSGSRRMLSCASSNRTSKKAKPA